MTVTRTFTDELTEAHRKGDEALLNSLLDAQAGIREECADRIREANNSAANLAHQLQVLTNLVETAREYDMDISNGDAPLLNLQGVVSALQDWMGA